jgi:hypothetical protein
MHSEGHSDVANSENCGKLAAMRYYLIVFDRENHSIVKLEQFEDSSEAIRARFKLEIEHRDQDYEVVVLGASSREALENTHSRYFGQGRELSSI